MADQLQLRGGTTTEHNTFTGASKEVTIDTTKKTAVVHDGSTAGGNPLMREDGANSSLALGSEASPSLKWNTNTGLYAPGANQVAISTAGTGRLFIDASGNVGVGTTPEEILHIKGPSEATGDRDGVMLQHSTAASTADTGLPIVWSGYVSSAAANYGLASICGRKENGTDADAAGYLQFATGSSAGSVTEKARITSDGNLGLGTSTPSKKFEIADGDVRLSDGYTISWGDDNWRIFRNGTQLRFDASGTQALTIDSSQRVGIGTASPGANLEIKAASVPAIRLNQADTYYAPIKLAGNDLEIRGSSGTIEFYNGATDGDSSTEKMRLDSSGRLLVGSTSESGNALLTVRGNTGSSTGAGVLDLGLGTTRPGSAGTALGYLRFTSTSNSASNYHYAAIYAETDGTSTSDTDIPGRLVFSTTADGSSSPTERMRITKEGVVKISKDGTYISAASGVHEIRTNLNSNNALIVSSSASNGTQYGVSIRMADDQNDTTRDFLECRGGTTLRAQIRSNGGLANYQSNNVDLSDERTKRDIASASSAWDCVQAWEVVNYNYLDDPADDTPRIGVIAQQVQQYCPEVVIPYQETQDAVLDGDGNIISPAKEERLGVREQQMMWMAVKALQEAQLRIETLEAEVAALKGA